MTPPDPRSETNSCCSLFRCLWFIIVLHQLAKGKHWVPFATWCNTLLTFIPLSSYVCACPMPSNKDYLSLCFCYLFGTQVYLKCINFIIGCRTFHQMSFLSHHIALKLGGIPLSEAYFDAVLFGNSTAL